MTGDELIKELEEAVKATQGDLDEKMLARDKANSAAERAQKKADSGETQYTAAYEAHQKSCARLSAAKELQGK